MTDQDQSPEGPDLSLADFYDALEERERPVVTAGEVARAVDCSQAAAREALERLRETGDLQRLDVDRDPTVWFPTDYKETAGRERVVVFPKRREIVVDQPAQFTRAQLSQFAHLADANREEGYVYEVRRADVWSAPHDRLEDLLGTMRQALGGRSESLEEWARSQWERARKFRLYTHEDGYTVLEAQSADLMGNIAEQELEPGQLRARLSDTEAWIADDAVAAVKRALYEAGYPVFDQRDLETGEDLPVDLETDLRDYQGEWVTRFLDRTSGILVGPPGSGKTVTALAVMAAIEGETLILVPGRELASQWRDVVLSHTSLAEEQVGEYHGGEKRIRPVTIATYQTAGMDRHRHLFDDRQWGLIVYDEVHHIPAPIHRRSADLQAKHRLGLSVDGNTVLPVRRDGEIEMVRIEDLATEFLGNSTGVKPVDGLETLGVSEQGEIEWTQLEAVMRHGHDGPLYKVRARNGREVTVTEDHSLVVFDGEETRIRSKLPGSLTDEDYLLQPVQLPEPDASRDVIDVMELLDEGYVLVSDTAPDSIFDPLYEQKIRDNKSRYNWKSRGNLPLSVAREICLDREFIDGVYIHRRDAYIPPEVPVEPLARLLGLFISDGALDDSRVEFYATDSKQNSEVKEFEQVIRSVCPEANISRISNGENCTTLQVSGPLVRVFKQIGLSNGAREKQVPALILSNPDAYEPFLEGIVLGDGHRQQRDRNREIVTISTSSDNLAQGLNFILSALGHVGGNYRRNPDVGVREGEHDTTTNNLVRFNPKNRTKRSRTSMVPFISSLKEAYDTIQRYPPHKADGGQTIENGLAGRSRLNSRELATILDRSDFKGEWLLDTDVAMLEVDSVTEVQGGEHVYDVSTGSENFLGNHLFCHNSATPIREDDKQQEIFTLIGPPIGTNWSALFDAGYVAEPEIEIRLVPWGADAHAETYQDSRGHARRQVAAENPAKVEEIRAILRDHPGAKALVFVEYIEQGDRLAEALGVPFVSGEMPHARRRKLFDEFRNGPRDALVVSRVGDEGLDLPQAEIAIDASGLGGSRRQGAQRAGRTMRPVGKARMYVLATRGTEEEDFARQRTRHLQGKGIRVTETESAAFDEQDPDRVLDPGE